MNRSRTSSTTVSRPRPRRFARQLKGLIALVVAVFTLALAANSAQAWDVQQAELKVSKVTVNGKKASEAKVAPGATVRIGFAYSLSEPGCGGCIDQIEVGFGQDAGPQGCAYNGIPGTSGTSGTTSIDLVAPTQPGAYFVAIDRGQDFGCGRSSTSWWNGTPNPQNQYIARLVVKAPRG